MRVLLHRDGLLVRFGRPLPDAVGLVAELQRLVAGLRRRPRAGSRDATVELAALETTAATAEPGSPLDVESARGGAAQGAGHPPADAFGDLPLLRARLSELSADGDLLFTASHAVLAAARAAGLAAFRVGTGVGDEDAAADDEALAFADVPRRVEEALRLPTARPMAVAVRTGGLLAIPVASAAAARDEALAAVRRDPRADWVRTAGNLLLYSEDPDLEDRLAERDGVERLSYGVNLGDLAFVPARTGEEAERIPPEGRQGSLFTGDGIDLRADGRSAPPGSAPPRASESASGRGDGEGGDASRRGHPAESSRRAAPPDAADGTSRRAATAPGPDETSAGRPPWSWTSVRRGLVPPPGPAPAPASPRSFDEGGIAADLAAAYRDELSRLTEALAGLDRDTDPAALLAAVRRCAGAGSAADFRPGTTARPHPGLLAWQTPFTDPARDDLAVVLHPPVAASPTAAGAADQSGPGHALAAALAVAALLRQLPSAPGTLHLVPLAPTGTTVPPASEPLARAAPFLLADEPHRVHHVVDLSASAATEAPPAVLAALAVPPPSPAAASEPGGGP